MHLGTHLAGKFRAGIFVRSASCRYDGTMFAKATLRLPVPLLERLRERSRQEGRSLNETAIHALELGLGGPAAEESWRALGRVLEVAPTHRYDADSLRRRWARLGPAARGLPADLDWIRGER